MALPLTVRNLTSTALTLKGIERFEDPNSLQSKPSAFSFASHNTTSLAPTAPKLGEHALTFNHQDLDVKLEPFESYTLTGLGQESDGNVAVFTHRLTIETPESERYRIDANPTYTQKESHSFTPLTPNPSSSYTALYHPINSTPHLAIHTNHLHDLSKWMSLLPSNLPLSAISIPGTHNAHTYYRALPSVRCQAVDVKTQLDNGIRFLDIRVQPSHAVDTSKKDLYLVHGAFPVSLTGTKYLEPVLQICYDFLTDNPSETILISLKREGVGNSTDAQLSQILEQHYITPNKSKWHTNPAIPYLGDVRGKLVLVRRYTLHSSSLPSPSLSTRDDDGGYGLDATTWPYNTTQAHHGPFFIQDFCEVLQSTQIPDKLKYSSEHLVRAAECVAFIPGVNTDMTNPLPAGPLYLNFCSGSNFWKKSCWPDAIAKVVNRGLEEWICMGHHLVELVSSPSRQGTADVDATGSVSMAGTVRKAKEGDGGTGVVVMDFVGEGGDWDLVKLIVGLNMGVLRRVEST